MAGYVSGDVRIDVVGPTSIVAGNATATSNYVDMSRYNKVMFVVSAGTMDSSGVLTLAMQAARTSTGSGTFAVGVNATMNSGAAAGGLVIDKAAEIHLNCSSDAGLATGQAYIINGITYTARSSVASTAMSTGYFAADRFFLGASGGDGSSTPWLMANHLAAYVNHASFGVPGVIAIVDTNSSGIDFRANATPGDAAITMTFPVTSGIHYIRKMVGSVEALSELLTSSSGPLNYVAVQIISSGAAGIGVSGVAVRSGARYSPNTTGLMTYEFGTT